MPKLLLDEGYGSIEISEGGEVITPTDGLADLLLGRKQIDDALLEELETLLDRLSPVDLVIAPFVFRLLDPVEGTPSHEVVSLHWLPLATLLDPAVRAPFEHLRDGTVVQLPSLRVAGLVIWGLTHRMFTNFATVLEA